MREHELERLREFCRRVLAILKEYGLETKIDLFRKTWIVTFTVDGPKPTGYRFKADGLSIIKMTDEEMDEMVQHAVEDPLIFFFGLDYDID